MLYKFLEYDLNTNLAFIDNLHENPEHDQYALKWLRHILNAQFIWNARMKNIGAPYSLDYPHPKDDLKHLFRTAHEETKDYLQQHQLEDSVTYKNSTGAEYHNTVEDIVLHICNHSNYHRAQIAYKWRKEDRPKIDSNYISWRREGLHV